MSISSQTQISKLKIVSSELSNSVTDIRSIKDKLVSSEVRGVVEGIVRVMVPPFDIV